MNKITTMSLFLSLGFGHTLLHAEDTRILSLPSGIIDFGDVNISEVKTKTITIANEGNATLTISSIRLHDKIKNNFSITNWTGGILPNQSIDINMTFIPNQVGRIGGLFYVNSDKTNSGDRSSLLKGNGTNDILTTKTLRVCEDGVVDCIESKAIEEFGAVEIGTSATRTVTIYNDGNAPLTVTGMRLHEKIRDMYRIDNPWTGIIPAGGSHNIDVTYTPTDTGLQQGRIYILTDKTSGYNRKELIGEGTSTLTDCAGSISIQGLRDYGIIPRGNTASKTFKIENLGTNPLVISNVYLHPRLQDAFSIDGNWTNVTIPKRDGESAKYTLVTINYNSNTASEPIEQGNFYVTSNSCTGNHSKFIRAEYTLDEHRILDFSGIKDFQLGANTPSVTQTLSIENNGNADLIITRISLHERIRDSFLIDSSVIDALPLTIAPNNSYSFDVEYNGVINIGGLIYVKGNNTNATDGTMVLHGRVYSEGVNE